ncbi:MAG: TonB-dependent receptor [Kofleriaceae bacterium]
MNMKNFLSAFMTVGILAGASAVVEPQEVFAQTGATVGQLRGVIRDKATGQPAVGATVVATSPSLQGEQVAITEDGGQYFITALPPGLYVLTVYYADSTFSRGNVLIQVGKEAVVNVTVDSGAKEGRPKGEVIEIQGSAPIVDQGSTKTGVSFGDDYTRNIPVARTFGGVVGAAAGSTNDFFGSNFSGATSLENTYVVEGINTTDTSNGALSSNLPTEFIQETEVITGGYNAEYGRATGGIVNVVTKSGSNEFHGSVFGYFTPGALVADAETIVREGQSIDSNSKLNYAWDLGAELGGPIIKDKLWFHVGFNPSIRRTDNTRIVSQVVDEDHDGFADPADPMDPEGAPRLVEVSRSSIPSKRDTYFFTGKISGAIDQNNQFQVSLFGNPQMADSILTELRRPAETALIGVDEGAYDVSAKYTSKLNEGKTQIDVVAGFHRGYETQKPLNARSAQALERYNYERSLYDFADLEGANAIAECNDNDPNDPYPNFRNCPISQYRAAGLGTIEERTNDRASFTASLTQRVKLAGYHTFKAGGDVEFSTYDSLRYLTGGEALTRSCNVVQTASGGLACDTMGDPTALPGRWSASQFVRFKRDLTPDEIAALGDDDDANDPMFGPGEVVCGGGGALCERADQLNASTNNRSIALYLSDSWQIRPNFTLNLGIRWEQQAAFVAEEIQGKQTASVIPGLTETFPENAFTLNDLWAPRIGFIYDPTSEGKAKVFGHYGRFYENMPMRLNVRLYGGEVLSQTTLNQNRLTMGDPGYDPNCNVDYGNPDVQGTIDQCSDQNSLGVLGEGLEIAAPSLKGQYSQEFVLGTEYEILADLKVGLNWIHRSMPSVIEDVLSPTGEYILANPGQNFDDDAAEFDRQADELMGSSDPMDQAKVELLRSRAATLRRVKTYDTPERIYDGIQVTANQRPTKNSIILASYTYSRTRGNYPGLFIPETNQDDPNITAQFDQPSLSPNRFGLLSLDRTHNLKVDGFYMFDFKKSGTLTTGASLRAVSGIPHSTLGADAYYGDDEVYILKRGTSGRSPLTTTFDLHLGYGYQINKTTKVEIFGDIFNLFNSQLELDQDQSYTFDYVLPIVGGDARDLEHLKTNDENGAGVNQSPTKNKNFGRLNERAASRSIRFGARLTF